MSMEKSSLVIKRKKRQKRFRQSIVPYSIPGETWTIRSGDLRWAKVSSNLNGSLTRTLTSDPRWEEKVAKRADATNPYKVSRFPTKDPYINSEFYGSWRYKSGKSTIIAQCKGYPLLTQANPALVHFQASDIARLESLALLGLLAKIRELEHSWSAPTFLGELKETIHMVRNPLGGLFRQSRSYRRRARRIISSYRRRPGKMMDLLNNQYLQWTYGVAPLINDVKGAMEAIQEFLTPDVARLTRLQTTLKEVLPPESWAGNKRGYMQWESGGIWFLFHRHAELLSSVRFMCGVQEETQGPSVDRAIQLSGMDLANTFVPTAYELLPYSFLLDYVSTVGSVVNGLFTHTGSVVWKCKSFKFKETAGVFIVPAPGTLGACQDFPLRPHVRILSSEIFERKTASLDVGLKDIRLKMPNTGQLINMLSLAFARFRSEDLDYRT